MWEDNETQVQFKLIGGTHTFRDERGAIEPGETFKATPFEVRNIQHKVEPLEPIPEEQEKPPIQRFQVLHKGGGRYAVINEATGETVNDKWLSKTEANELAGIDDESETGEAEAGEENPV